MRSPQGVPIVPVVLTGHGYDYVCAREQLLALPARLNLSSPPDFAELEQLLQSSAASGDIHSREQLTDGGWLRTDG
jgi:hypothetical protein